jgi:hypothetical protein
VIDRSCFVDCRELGRIVLGAGCKLSPEAVADLRSQCRVSLR